MLLEFDIETPLDWDRFDSSPGQLYREVTYPSLTVGFGCVPGLVFSSQGQFRSNSEQVGCILGQVRYNRETVGSILGQFFEPNRGSGQFSYENPKGFVTKWI